MGKYILREQKGYTYLEVILVMAVMTILLGFITINLLNAHKSTSQSTSITAIASDLRNQQFNAMVGSTEGRTTSDSYGLYITPTSYVLFHGTAYSPSDTSNLTVNIQNGFQLTTTLSNSLIIFSHGSGEVKNYNANNNTITLTDTTNNTQKTLRINQYGVVTQVN